MGLNEEIYTCPCGGFEGSDGISKVLRLIKSLYGIFNAPKTFFDKFRADILEQGLIQTKLYPSLFMKSNIICLFCER